MIFPTIKNALLATDKRSAAAKLLAFQACRNISANVGQGNSKTAKPTAVYRDPVRQVLISQSSDVFTNLALEDWLYRNHDFDHKSLLLLWRNDPCVVIGRHQNPWTEANVPYLRHHRATTKLARRNSGGGTVYHDLGNVNCTFFTRRSAYDRRRNLDIVCRAIQSITQTLDVAINQRDDIVINGQDDDSRKVSGTAAKLGGKSAYHHCTVLVDVNECVLHDALNSQAEGVESRATQSVRVPVRNLRHADPNIRVDTLQEALGWQFLKTDVDGVDGGMEAAAEQRGFQMVLPDDKWFPGLEKLRLDLESHNWIFGKTPKFKVHKQFGVPEHLLPESAKTSGADNPQVTIELEVVHGVVESVRVQQHPYVGLINPRLESDLSSAIHGVEFGPDLTDAVLSHVGMPSANRIFLADCVHNMTSKFA